MVWWVTHKKLALVNYPGAQDIAHLKKEGITAQVNVAGEVHVSNKGIKSTNASVYSVAGVAKAIKAIHDYLQAGEVVAVNCNEGLNRSPATLIAYLQYIGVPLNDAYNMVLKGKLDVSPDTSVLRDYDTLKERLDKGESLETIAKSFTTYTPGEWTWSGYGTPGSGKTSVDEDLNIKDIKRLSNSLFNKFPDDLDDTEWSMLSGALEQEGLLQFFGKVSPKQEYINWLAAGQAQMELKPGPMQKKIIKWGEKKHFKMTSTRFLAGQAARIQAEAKKIGKPISLKDAWAISRQKGVPKPTLDQRPAGSGKTPSELGKEAEFKHLQTKRLVEGVGPLPGWVTKSERKEIKKARKEFRRMKRGLQPSGSQLVDELQEELREELMMASEEKAHVAEELKPMFKGEPMDTLPATLPVTEPVGERQSEVLQEMHERRKMFQVEPAKEQDRFNKEMDAVMADESLSPEARSAALRGISNERFLEKLALKEEQRKRKESSELSD